MGALVPLSLPGWIEASQHMLAGLDLAVHDVRSREDYPVLKFSSMLSIWCHKSI